MAPLTLGTFHHIRLTVTDLERSKAFYTEVLGFQVAMDTLPPEDDECGLHTLAVLESLAAHASLLSKP